MTDYLSNTKCFDITYNSKNIVVMKVMMINILYIVCMLINVVTFGTLL